MKLSVAVIENDATFCGILCEKLIYYARYYSYNLNISTFSNWSGLKKAKYPFHLLVIDTSCNDSQTSAIEWVNENRRSEYFAHVMFVSGDAEKVFETIETNPIAFIRKDCMDEDLMRAWRVYNDKKYEMPIYEVLPEGRKRYIFDIEKIMYLSSNGHYIDVILCNGRKKVIRGKIGEMEVVLGKHGFIRVHTSYLVNLRHIEYVTERKVCLSNKEALAISAKYREYLYRYLAIYGYEVPPIGN